MKTNANSCKECKHPLPGGARQNMDHSVVCPNRAECIGRQASRLRSKLRRSSIDDATRAMTKRRPPPRRYMKYKVMCPNGDVFAVTDDADLPLSWEAAGAEKLTADTGGCECVRGPGEFHVRVPIGKPPRPRVVDRPKMPLVGGKGSDEITIWDSWVGVTVSQEDA